MGAPGQHHLPELQSLRGLAAMLVVVHHCIFAVTLSPDQRAHSEVLVNAHAAVCSFFVLSGYVLARSLWASDVSFASVLQFYVRRAFRIAPALWVTSALTVVYLLTLHYRLGLVDASAWLARLFPVADFRPLRVAASAMTLNGFLSPTYWSLFVEIVGSMLLPWMVALARRSPAAFWLLAGALVAFALTKGAALHMSCGVYLASFAFGASILLWSRRLGEVVRSDATALCLAALCLATMAWFRQLGPWSFEVAYHAALPALVESFAAMVLVALIVSRPAAFGLLRWRPIVRLGDISYSLYLLHFVLMVALVKISADLLPAILPVARPAALTLVVLALGLPLSALSYRYVELPGIAAGRRVVELFRLQQARSALA